MSILVKNIRLSLDYRDEDVLKRLGRELKLAPDCRPAWRFRRRSLDARRKNDLHFLADVEVDLPWRRSYAANANLSWLEEKKAEKSCSKENLSAVLKGQECQAATSAGQESQIVVSASPNNEAAASSGQVSQQHKKMRPLVVGAGPALSAFAKSKIFAEAALLTRKRIFLLAKGGRARSLMASCSAVSKTRGQLWCLEFSPFVALPKKFSGSKSPTSVQIG